jgi:hypothetical protein
MNRSVFERNFFREKISGLQSSGKGKDSEKGQPARSAGAVQGAVGPEPKMNSCNEQLQSTDLLDLHSASYL